MKTIGRIELYSISSRSKAQKGRRITNKVYVFFLYLMKSRKVLKLPFAYETGEWDERKDAIILFPKERDGQLIKNTFPIIFRKNRILLIVKKREIKIGNILWKREEKEPPLSNLLLIWLRVRSENLS